MSETSIDYSTMTPSEIYQFEKARKIARDEAALAPKLAAARESFIEQGYNPRKLSGAGLQKLREAGRLGAEGALAARIANSYTAGSTARKVTGDKKGGRRDSTS